MTARRVAAVAALLLAAACSDPGTGPTPPRILTSRADPNPGNVLSAVVLIRAESADSGVVRYALGDGDFDGASAAMPIAGDSALVPVLGLLPESQYRLRAIVYGGGSVTDGDVLSFRTGALPADLPRYSASGSNPTPGYVVFAAGKYGLAIDNTGRVVWYHRFPDGPGLNFMPLRTGRYAARPATPDPADRDPWVEIDVLGNTVRTLGCARGLVPRFHDLIARPDGSYWLMCDETRAMDLSALGGVAAAMVTGTVVQRLDATGSLVFEWSAFDHFALADLELASRTGPTVNWTHGNAIDLDADGNLVISFRSLSEIAKIDTRTGAILWRMGGLKNEFRFSNTAMPPFHRQHGVRLDAGQIVLLDNLGEPAGSRAERYRYDPVAGTASLVAVYAPHSPVTALLGGTTQSLSNGHTLVAYGNGGRVEQYDATGAIVWRIDGNAGYVFRAQRISSLYAPGTDLAR